MPGARIAVRAVRRSLWRVRTTPDKRVALATATFAVVIVVGAALMLLPIAGLRAAGAPGWVVALPWIIPTVGAVVWSVVRPTPARLTDDDDDSWVGYSIRLMLVGSEEPRTRPARVVAALLFGAPVAWSLIVFGVLELLGVF